MKILPYEKYSLKCNCRREKIVEILQKNTDVNRPFIKFKDSKKFWGKVELDSFKIERQISYRNNFLPVIIGRMIENEEKTIIEIKMRMHILVEIFVIIWLSFALSIGGITGKLFLKNLINNGGFKGELLTPFFMFLLGLTLTNVAFWLEVRKVKEEFIKLLEEFMDH
ncbi:MAG: hypothetical protein JXM74_08600 [Fusobacteriaceae bacterium]|nr:hypothetical protein [Fusobacteriaceae bacterium]MBN2838797.1 hypothetical protein [Fusobacteriaceae bacterium]